MLTAKALMRPPFSSGSEVAMPLRPDERYVVARHEWRKCVVVEPARDASAAA